LAGLSKPFLQKPYPLEDCWGAYNPSQRVVMVFGADTRQVNDPQSEIRQMWDKLAHDDLTAAVAA
jgi:carboxylesterase type B